MPDSVFIKAPAKLNLALAVGPADADNEDRHPICSWMTGISLYDDLTITPLEADRFSRYAIIWHDEAKRTVDIDWPITTDLAVRAHLLLESTTGRRLPVQLKLEKRIPVGSGLGGGSSNAAAMLLGCNELFELGMSTSDLVELASRLGSDVAFFIEPQPMLVEGFGERLIAVTAISEPSHFVLLLPDFGCPTAAVYRAFDDLAFESGLSREDLAARFREGKAGIDAMCDGTPLQDVVLFNHLTVAAHHVRPDLRELARAAAEVAEDRVHLTGSGSAMFLVADSSINAELLAEIVNERVEGLLALPVESDLSVRT